MKKLSFKLILLTAISLHNISVHETSASDACCNIFGAQLVPQGSDITCENAKLYIDESGKLDCGTENSELTDGINPGTVSITKVIDKNNEIVPHIISGKLNVYKDGMFINKCIEINNNKLSSTVILSHTSNINTDSFPIEEFGVKDDNIAPNNSIILNGESYHTKQIGNSIITFEPGAKVNLNEDNSTAKDNKGQIYGGIVDLTPYVRIDEINNEPQLRLDTYNGKAVTLDNGQIINAHIKNAFIKLFIQEDVDNVKKKLTLDSNIDPTDNTTDNTTDIDKILFNKIKFTQCLSEIPGSGCYNGYGVEKQCIINHTGRINEPDYLKYNGSDNTDVVKKLFNGELNPIITGDLSTEIYNLKFKNIGYLKSFAELYKQYINYNCYIKTNDDVQNNYKLSENISDEVVVGSIKYPVSNEYPIDQAYIALEDNIEIPNTNPQQYIDNKTSNYIQVRGNNVHTINFISEEKNRTLYVYNEWIWFGGTIKLNNILNVVQEYYPINKKYHGYSIQLQSNKNVNYIFRKNGIIDLNYLPVNDSGSVNLTLRSITVLEGRDSQKKNKVRCNKCTNANRTNVIVERIRVQKHAVLKFLPGTKLIINGALLD